MIELMGDRKTVYVHELIEWNDFIGEKIYRPVNQVRNEFTDEFASSPFSIVIGFMCGVFVTLIFILAVLR